ncbi:MAG: PKD domain-containing protein, partial [Candidatus Bathyarchaeota archaeon]|nr:PKD domain-containing protein [Candidatus Bathyarchaeota archaeon]
MKNRHLIMFAMVLNIVGATLFTHVTLTQFTDPIVNGGFETGTTLGWTIDGGYFEIRNDPAGAHTGNYYLWGIALFAQQNLPPVNLPNCHLSFWYLGDYGSVQIICSVGYSDGHIDQIDLIGGPIWQEATLQIDPTKDVAWIALVDLSASVSAIDDVAIIYEGVPPIASFTESAHTAPVGTEITFNASSSYDPDGTIALYEWDFESDETYDATGVTKAHTYMTDGTYTVTLRVTDNDGLTGTATDTKTITQPATIESCDQSGNPKDIFDPGEIVYAKGIGYDPNEMVEIHVVPNGGPYDFGLYTVPAWATLSGELGPISLESLPMGQYDIWVDTEPFTGILDVDEPVDTFGLDYGFSVVLPTTIESCDQSGNPKDIFDPGEIVYAKGIGYDPNYMVSITVVPNGGPYEWPGL